MAVKALIAAATLLTGIGCACAQSPQSPMDWATVHTNLVAEWKAKHGAPKGVKADKAGRKVTVLAEATGLSEREAVEFFAIGPLSDRAYESMFVTVASPAAIAEAAEEVGLPLGTAPNMQKARLWPQGEKVRLAVRRAKDGKEFGFGELVEDHRAKEEGAILEKPLVWTGGERDAAGSPTAATNIPCAVFSTYTSAQSLLLLDGLFDQSSTYGRFKPKEKREKGELFELEFGWDGKRRVRERTVELTAAGAAKTLEELKSESAAAGGELYLKIGFGAGVKVREAAVLAKAFEVLDGKAFKANGAAEGQFYYRALLPDQEWRNRGKRLFQPFEVRVGKDGAKTFTHVEEDWSGEGLDPVLKPKTTAVKDWGEVPGLIKGLGEAGEKIFVLFIFADGDAEMGELLPLAKILEGRITTFYVFEEQ